jgi:O-antigen biosynthesis protein
MKIHDVIKGQLDGYSAWRNWLEAQPPPKPTLDIPVTAYLFSLVIDARGVAADKVERTLASLCKQYFRNIEVFLLLDGTDDQSNWANWVSGVRGLRGLSWHVIERGKTKLKATGDLSLRGDYVGFVAPGSLFDEQAFELAARTLRDDVEGQDPELVVFDWDVVQTNGSFAYPCFMPGWDELLYREVDYLRDNFLLSRTFISDLAVNVSEENLRHNILRYCENNTAMSSLHVEGPHVHLPHDDDFEDVRLALPLPHISKATASIVIPNQDSPQLLKACISTLQRTTEMALEIIVVDNNSTNSETLKYYQDIKAKSGAKIVPVAFSFNFSRMINRGVAASSSSTVVFLNNDIEFTEAGQMDVLAQWTMLPRMGAVGSMLRYADHSVQHAGCILVPFDSDNLHVGRHARKGPGYLGMFGLPRSWQVVTGALLGTRREIFDRVGGLNEIELPIEHNDVDYCLSVGSLGLDVCCLPLIGVLHKESSSREKVLSSEGVRIRSLAEIYMKEKWRKQFADDKFTNRYLNIAEVVRPTLQRPQPDSSCG